MSFAARERAERTGPPRNLQYPQRMDGLCSDARRWSPNTRIPPLAVSSADGRALQHLVRAGQIWPAKDLAVSSADGRALQRSPAQPRLRSRTSCSILSGWTGFAAERTDTARCTVEVLQYPQRMDGLCSALEIRERHLAHLRLAVSSADGRALQRSRLFVQSGG